MIISKNATIFCTSSKRSLWVSYQCRRRTSQTRKWERIVRACSDEILWDAGPSDFTRYNTHLHDIYYTVYNLYIYIYMFHKIYPWYIYIYTLQRKLSDWGLSAIARPRSLRFGQSSDHPLIFSDARLYKAMEILSDMQDIHFMCVCTAKYIYIYIYASTRHIIIRIYSLGFPGYVSCWYSAVVPAYFTRKQVPEVVGWVGDDYVLCTCTPVTCYATDGVVGWVGDDYVLCTCTCTWQA